MPLVRPVTVAVVAGGRAGHRGRRLRGRPDERGDRVAGDRAAAVRRARSSSPVADALPAVAVTPVGRAGAVGAVGVTAFDAAEAGPVPTALVAVTVKVYAVPLVSPVTVVVVAGGLPVTVVGVCAVVPMNGVTV